MHSHDATAGTPGKGTSDGSFRNARGAAAGEVYRRSQYPAQARPDSSAYGLRAAGHGYPRPKQGFPSGA